jgi:uncharacterized protein (TIGR00730 family)
MGARPSFAEAARALGAELGRRRIGLVYGGASIGVMGALADAALAAGGEVIGVIPHGLERKEIAHKGLTRLEVVGSMHERKALMSDLSDGFIAMPGGFGTFDELFEIITWRQIGLHAKPVGLLDVDGYFEPLRQMVARGVTDGFIPPAHAELPCEADPSRLLDALELSAPPSR